MPEQDEAETASQLDERPQDVPASEVEVDASPEAPSEPAELSPPPPPRLSRADRDLHDRRRRRFAACGRCSYFVADCGLYLGESALQSAILAAGDGWLQVEGDATLHKLAMNAYGVHLDETFELFDGICPECRRRFVLAREGDDITRLKIRL